MKVIATLYNPPGRGEMVRRDLTAPDSEMPGDAISAGTRSVSAMKHFFPSPIQVKGWASLPIGRALVCIVEDGRKVVRGSHWEVEWITDEALRERSEFFARFMEGKVSNEDFIARIEATPTAMVCDLTINHQRQGVPA